MTSFIEESNTSIEEDNTNNVQNSNNDNNDQNTLTDSTMEDEEQQEEEEHNWEASEGLKQAVRALHGIYEEYDCKWESIDFVVFTDDISDTWCFRCIFSYPEVSKKRCVVYNNTSNTSGKL